MKMPSQLPWRRLFQNSAWTEEVRDGALFLSDRGTGADEWANLVYPWSAVPGRLAVAEAQAKVVASSDPLGVCMRVANGGAVDYLVLEPARIGLRFADLWRDMDTTTDFHTYRVAVRGSDIRVYVDGALALDGKGKFITPATQRSHWLPFAYGKEDWNRDSFVFGSATGPGTGEALWRNVRLQDNAKVWTDLCLRVSYPTQAPPVPEWDVVLDGSSLPGTPWTRERERPSTLAEVRDGTLLVADRGTEQGSYLHFRHPWNVDPARGGTVEARMRVLSGWSTIRCDDGVHTERLEISPDGIRLVYARGLRYSMDTTGGFHTYRVVVRNQDIKVYVDGLLRIDGVGRYAKAAPEASNGGELRSGQQSLAGRGAVGRTALRPAGLLSTRLRDRVGGHGRDGGAAQTLHQFVLDPGEARRIADPEDAVLAQKPLLALAQQGLRQQPENQDRPREDGNERAGEGADRPTVRPAKPAAPEPKWQAERRA